MLRCRNKRPIKGLLRFVMTTNFSRDVVSTTSICISTVAIGASNFPFETVFRDYGRGPIFSNVCRASNRILCKLASGMALDKAPVSMTHRYLTPQNSLEKIAFCVFL